MHLLGCKSKRVARLVGIAKLDHMNDSVALKKGQCSRGESSSTKTVQFAKLADRQTLNSQQWCHSEIRIQDARTLGLRGGK
jgi:hypothetical protein